MSRYDDDRRGGGPDRQRDRDEAAKIFVGGLPDSLNVDGLRREFEKFGRIVDCFTPGDRDTGRGPARHHANAMATDGTEINTKPDAGGDAAASADGAAASTTATASAATDAAPVSGWRSIDTLQGTKLSIQPKARWTRESSSSVNGTSCSQSLFAAMHISHLPRVA